MSKISVLPEELSNRIAAGEVVERPASVVKELFENAVDAGATSITVEIERAGSRLIRVSDNGSGMDEADAILCFSPHATSKIKNADDIECITTLGFRGEALPSIASVSKLSLKTRTADSPSGLEIIMEGGKVIEQRPAGMPIGTVMSVRDLFYNVPARKKFLRSPATEEAHIQEMVIALALGFPEVSVVLKFDNKISLQVAGASDPEARAAGLFGKAFAGKMLKVNHVAGELVIKGLIAVPGFTRTSRREQRTFVNGRAVESNALYRGIRDGYGTLADFGRFPPVILNIQMDAYEYDINVHPTKREVRFKREYVVSNAVCDAVKNALSYAPAPEIQLPGDQKLARADILMSASEINYQPKIETPVIPGLGKTEYCDTTPAQEHIFSEITDTTALHYTAPARQFSPELQHKEEAIVPEKSIYQIGSSIPLPQPGMEQTHTEKFIPETAHKLTDRPLDEPLPVDPLAPINRTPLAKELSNAENMRYVGIIFGTFIILEELSDENMYLIDFHAAHERVLFENLLRKAQSDEPVASQQLLLPPAIELSRTAAAFINKNEKIFTRLGFDATMLSSNTVLLNSVPANLSSEADWECVLSDMVNTLLEGEKNTRDSLEAIARAACHSAVKAHDPLNETSAKALLKSLSLCQRPDVCPHGRPTVLKISKQELARRFGRI